jgi:hypothetical protein
MQKERHQMAETAEDEMDYPVYAAKAPTQTQARFAQWLIDKCQYSFTTRKEEAAFRDGVRVATALRMPFQRSPENQEVLLGRRVELEEPKPAKIARKPKPVEEALKVGRSRKAPKKAAPPAAFLEETAEAEEVEAPKPTRARKTATRTPAAEPVRPLRKPARRRAVAAASDDAEEAPF